MTTSPSDTSSIPTNTPLAQSTTSAAIKKISNQDENEYIVRKETTRYDKTEIETTRLTNSTVQINLLPEKDLKMTSDIYTRKTSPTVERSNKKSTVKLTSNKDDKTKIDDQEESKPTLQQTFKTEEKDTKTTVELKYDNSTIITWTATSTYKPLSTTPTTELHSTESAIPTKYDVQRKLLPFTKTDATKATSKEIETTNKPETTHMIPTTAKFKPKEIWIKPAQKGEIPITDWKAPSTKSKQSTQKWLPSTTTTPRTIIVSIIPTSMSYSTFKKIYLTTASSLHTQQLKTSRSIESHGITTLTTNPTTFMPFTLKSKNSVTPKKQDFATTTAIPTVKTSLFRGSMATPTITKTTKSQYSEATNSMSMTNEVDKMNYPPSVPTVPSMHRESTSKLHTGTTTTLTPKKEQPSSPSTSTMKPKVMPTPPVSVKPIIDRNKSANDTDKAQNKTTHANPSKEVIPPTEKTKTTNTSMEKAIKLTTASTVTNTETNHGEEEIFPILTEPEHITAVAGDRPSEISTVDLIYVLSIVGGMVISIITIAVVIVMFERCKRHRYGDLMKMNNIRMQVVIDTNDRPPPPYVRSIFHTPLPGKSMLFRFPYWSK